MRGAHRPGPGAHLGPRDRYTACATRTATSRGPAADATVLESWRGCGGLALRPADRDRSLFSFLLACSRSALLSAATSAATRVTAPFHHFRFNGAIPAPLPEGADREETYTCTRQTKHRACDIQSTRSHRAHPSMTSLLALDHTPPSQAAAGHAQGACARGRVRPRTIAAGRSRGARSHLADRKRRRIGYCRADVSDSETHLGAVVLFYETHLQPQTRRVRADLLPLLVLVGIEHQLCLLYTSPSPRDS